MRIAQEKKSWKGLEELRPALSGFLARRCRDQYELDDIVQETLLRAARYRDSLTEPQRLRGWVLRIASNALRDHLRREVRIHPIESAEEIEGEVEPIDYGRRDPVEFELDGRQMELGELATHLPAALAQLPDADRQVLHLYYRDSCDCGEIAARMSIPRPLVRVRLYRARKRLLRLFRQRFSPLLEHAS